MGQDRDIAVEAMALDHNEASWRWKPWEIIIISWSLIGRCCVVCLDMIVLSSIIGFKSSFISDSWYIYFFASLFSVGWFEHFIMKHISFPLTDDRYAIKLFEII